MSKSYRNIAVCIKCKYLYTFSGNTRFICGLKMLNNSDNFVHIPGEPYDPKKGKENICFLEEFKMMEVSENCALLFEQDMFNGRDNI